MFEKKNIWVKTHPRGIYIRVPYLYLRISSVSNEPRIFRVLMSSIIPLLLTFQLPTQYNLVLLDNSR